MTWSIVARDPESGDFGIAVASRFFAVGAAVPFLESGVGAVATQALLNRFCGVDGLRLLAEGRAPDDVLGALLTDDPGREQRQAHLVNAAGQTAAHTGRDCVPWSGHLCGENFSVAGNMLAGAVVIEETAAAYQRESTLPFPRRLIAALRAGEAAGGDKRGKQSAGLLIYGREEWPDLNLRVDDHPDPLPELARLEAVSRERFVHFQTFLPRRGDRTGTCDRAVIEAGIAEALAKEGRG